jgi:hypothetical protein
MLELDAWRRWVAFILTATAFCLCLVAAVRGEYFGWMKLKALNFYRCGWRGYTICDVNYKNCQGEYVYQILDVANHMRAGLAFTILATLVALPAMFATFALAAMRTTFITMRLVVVLEVLGALFATIAWTIPVGRFYDVVNHSNVRFDNNPEYIITAFIMFVLSAWLLSLEAPHMASDGSGRMRLA